MKADPAQVAKLAGQALKLDPVRIRPLDVDCAWPVFRLDGPGGERCFVKVASWHVAARHLAVLAGASSAAFLPRVMFSGVPFPEECELLGLEWKDGTHVEPEDMTSAQCVSLADVSREYQALLGVNCRDVAPDPADDPAAQYAVLAEYASRHPTVSRLFRPLLDIPVADRSYSGRGLSPIHGDFHSLNYAFRDDSVSAVYDYDGMALGVACEDLAYAFAERAARCRGEKARRLQENFRTVVDAAPWGRDEWRFAVGHCRLRKASRRIAKHMSSPLVAVDVMRRDSFYGVLSEVLV